MATATTPLVTLDEYLHSSYEPDMEFVDGQLVGRNVGTQLHGLLQLALGAFLRAVEKEHGLRTFVETRLRLSHPPSHRIPDIMVVKRPYQRGPVVVDVPLATFEIKSPDDSFDGIMDKCEEYHQAGVEYVIVMDPERRRMFRYSGEGLAAVDRVSIATGQPEPLVVDGPTLFATLDD